MNIVHACLWLLLASPCCCATEAWLFLDDGRVGWGDPSTDPVTIRLATEEASVPKKSVQFQRTVDEIDHGVNAMLDDVITGKNLGEHAKRFHVLGLAAAPVLVERLKNPDQSKQRAALFGLQYCWNGSAQAAVLNAFENGDRLTRKLGFCALGQNLTEAAMAALMLKYADGDDLETAAMVFDVVDRQLPDPTLKRITRLLESPDYRSAVFLRLSHYLSPALTPDTLKLLDDDSPEAQRAGMLGLISQLASADEVRQRIQPFLKHDSADLREIAAEYFTWLGVASDAQPLKDALIDEKDTYVRAAIDTAIASIEKRNATPADAAIVADALKELATQDVLEPLLCYETHEHEQKERFRRRGFRLRNLCVGISQAPPAKPELPLVDVWVPPVRDYFDSKRKSFGVESRYATFSNCVHVGDDVAWGQELRTVVSVAPGVVRSVSHIFSWGYIIIIEHRMKDGSKVCSLYAHLSPLIHVKEGDVVAAGQKIASVGRSNTVENGGYHAHTHFGLHRGGYNDPEDRWVCGYVGTLRYRAGQHGWLAPQNFLHQQIDPPSEPAK
jgi:murein DD-endopeptidase MepM/ murein hydrolase activator NlpD